jgi:SAM-dependent methyltransferase
MSDIPPHAPVDPPHPLAIDSRERFSAAAELYRRYRPSYPGELIDWIIAETGIRQGAPVADVACGTGISTRLLAERGFKVIGIDPNPEMLVQAQLDGHADYRAGEAAATGLPPRSVAMVVVAQAFHWLELLSTLTEFRRILVPDGWCAAFWNLRASSPFLDAYQHLLDSFTPYRSVPTAEAKLREIDTSHMIRSLRAGEFLHSELLDLEQFLGRVGSASYVVHGVEKREELQRAVASLFNRHAKGGKVEVEYRCPARVFQLV